MTSRDVTSVTPLALVCLLLGAGVSDCAGGGGAPARAASPDPQYVPARFGSGLLADRPGQRLALPTADHLAPRRGTIEMWIEVGDCIDDDYEWNPLFVAQQQPYQPFSGLLLQLIDHGRRLVFVAGPLERSVTAEISWSRGESHLIAATWGEGGLALYIDGEQVGSNPAGPSIGSLPERMSLGGYLWEPAKNPADAIIDELRISGAPKSAAAVRAAFEAQAAFSAEADTLLIDHFDDETKRAAAAETWTLSPRNPVIGRHRLPAGLPASVLRKPLLIFNDPSVLREGDGYSMWASLGTEGGPQQVRIYRLTSHDGVTWSVANDGRPVLEPGDKRRGDFDWFGVETPAVIRIGTTYHMYYSSYHNGKVPEVTMGHATSPDGDAWTKQGELTSLTRVVGKREGNPWGWLARGEPAVVHVDGRFRLYFADVKCRRDDCSGSPAALRGISLATSSDGQSFEQHGSEPIVLQSAPYLAADGWEGYSTPWVVHDGESYDLYLDAFRHTAGGGGDGKSIQTALLHLRSADGVRFEMLAPDIVTIDDQDWCAGSVRAPSVVVEDGRTRMWFAGDNWETGRYGSRDLRRKDSPVEMGIGLAELR